MCCDAESRIGFKGGANEIKKHSFFKQINFESDLRKQPAPYIPLIRNALDTSNFEDINPDRLHSDRSDTEEWDTMMEMMSGKAQTESPQQQIDLIGQFQKGNKVKNKIKSRDAESKHNDFFEFTFRRFFDTSGHALPLRFMPSNSDNGEPTQTTSNIITSRGTPPTEEHVDSGSPDIYGSILTNSNTSQTSGCDVVYDEVCSGTDQDTNSEPGSSQTTPPTISTQSTESPITVTLSNSINVPSSSNGAIQKPGSNNSSSVNSSNQEEEEKDPGNPVFV